MKKMTATSRRVGIWLLTTILAGGAFRANTIAQDLPTEVRVITLSPDGFQPAEMTQRSGPFRLVIDNKSGSAAPEFHYELFREGADRIGEARTRDGKRNWRETLDLPPGTYLLTESSNPDWICRITISPR